MKVRNGFVSNSSSSNFMIKNATDKERTLKDFVADVGQFNDGYSGYISFDRDDVLDGVDEVIFTPMEEKPIEFESDANLYGRMMRSFLSCSGKKNDWEWYHTFDC